MALINILKREWGRWPCASYSFLEFDVWKGTCNRVNTASKKKKKNREEGTNRCVYTDRCNNVSGGIPRSGRIIGCTISKGAWPRPSTRVRPRGTAGSGLRATGIRSGRSGATREPQARIRARSFRPRLAANCAGQAPSLASRTRWAAGAENLGGAAVSSSWTPRVPRETAPSPSPRRCGMGQVVSLLVSLCSFSASGT